MTMAEFTLRPACEDDIDELCALNGEVMRAHVERTWGTWDAAFQRAYFRRAFTCATHKIIVVCGETAGCIAVESCETHLAINRVLLLPAFQNQGIGSDLLRRLIEESNRTGKPLRLSVLSVNEKALRLYERLGFVHRETTPERIFMERVPGPLRHGLVGV